MAAGEGGGLVEKPPVDGKLSVILGRKSIWDGKSIWMGNMLWPSLENIICHSLPLATTTSFHLQLYLPSPGGQLRSPQPVITPTDVWLAHRTLEMQLDMQLCN